MASTPLKKIEKQIEERENDYVTIPPVDIYESETEYVIKADIPGIKRENIEVELNNNRLEIRGKTETPGKDNLKYSEFTLNKNFRSFKVGNEIDSERIEAAVKDGVLVLTLHKKEEVKPKRIVVKAS